MRLRRHAFTLTEVVIAAVILAVLSVGIFGTMIMAEYLLGNAREHNAAEAIAADTAWTYFNKDYDTLVHMDSVVSQPVPQSSILSPLGGTVRVGVIQYNDHCEIQVRVDWTGRTVTHAASPNHETLILERYDTTH